VGTNDGVHAGDVVIDPVTGGLVGTVDRAFSGVASVTLLTDTQSAVTSVDLTSPTAIGIIQPGGGGSDALVLDLVSKEKVVNKGDTIITAGSLGKGPLPSMFPRGIRVGTVTSQGSNDVNPFMNIQVKPFADFSSLQSVIVLVQKNQNQ
jgi:rod shape-determining protein MreC